MERYTSQLQGFNEAELLARVIEASPTRCAYGAAVTWRDARGAKHVASVKYCLTERDARRSALRLAIRTGYTYPKWWQWWRWSETRPDLDFSANPSLSVEKGE
jgi:hypothetical protein